MSFSIPLCLLIPPHLKPIERSVSASADATEIRDVAIIDVKEERDISATLLFDPENHLEERIFQEQFAP